MTYKNLKKRLELINNELILREQSKEIDSNDPIVEAINDIFQQIIFENMDDHTHKRIDA